LASSLVVRLPAAAAVVGSTVGLGIFGNARCGDISV
jgi:hypothetical protein